MLPSLFVLTLVYGVGTLSSNLLGIVTRDMGRDMQYGDMKCFPNQDYSEFLEVSKINCSDARSNTSCADLGEEQSRNQSICLWGHSGTGLDYKVVSLPPFTTFLPIFGIIIAMIADRKSRRNVVAACLAAISIAAPRIGAAQAYWELVMFRIIICALESVFIPVCSSMISDMFPQELKSFMLGVFGLAAYLSSGLAFAIGHYGTAADVAGMGWRFCFISSGIVGFAALVLLLIFVEEPERKCKLDNSFIAKKPKLPSYWEPFGGNRTFQDIFQSTSFSKKVMEGESGLWRVKQVLSDPTIVVLAFAASAKLTADLSWTYSFKQLFSELYPGFQSFGHLTASANVGGAVGLVIGGAMSEGMVLMKGPRGKLYFVALSQLIASFLSIFALYFPPPGSSNFLLAASLFGEMWFGAFLAELLERTPPRIQVTTLAIFLFVVNNIGGNIPALIKPLKDVLSYKVSLYIMYPGFLFLSSAFFLLAMLLTEMQRRRISHTCISRGYI